MTEHRNINQGSHEPTDRERIAALAARQSALLQSLDSLGAASDSAMDGDDSDRVLLLLDERRAILQQVSELADQLKDAGSLHEGTSLGERLRDLDATVDRLAREDQARLDRWGAQRLQVQRQWQQLQGSARTQAAYSAGRDDFGTSPRMEDRRA